MTLPCKTGCTPRFGGLVVTAERGVLAERMDADVPAHLSAWERFCSVSLRQIILKELRHLLVKHTAGRFIEVSAITQHLITNRTNFIGEKRPNFVGAYTKEQCRKSWQIKWLGQCKIAMKICNLPHALSAFLPRYLSACRPRGSSMSGAAILRSSVRSRPWR